MEVNQVGPYIGPTVLSTRKGSFKWDMVETREIYESSECHHSFLHHLSCSLGNHNSVQIAPMRCGNSFNTGNHTAIPFCVVVCCCMYVCCWRCKSLSVNPSTSWFGDCCVLFFFYGNPEMNSSCLCRWGGIAISLLILWQTAPSWKTSLMRCTTTAAILVPRWSRRSVTQWKTKKVY